MNEMDARILGQWPMGDESERLGEHEAVRSRSTLFIVLAEIRLAGVQGDSRG